MRLNPMKHATAFLALSLAATTVCLATDTPTGDLPGPPSGTCTISPPAGSIRIPMEIYRGEIRIVGNIGGQKVRMLIDNGSLWDELLFFGSPRVDALGMERVGEATVGGAGAGDPVAADLVEGVAVSFTGEDGSVIEFKGQTGIVLPYEPDAPNPWEGSEGQISAAFFKRFVTIFSFDEGVLTLVRPEAFNPEGYGVEVPMTPLADNGSWTVPGRLRPTSLDEAIDVDMTIDLGWDEPLGINTGGNYDIRLPEGLKKTVLGLGAQGPIYGYHGTVYGLEFGGYPMELLEATFSTPEEGGSKAGEVMVGLGVFLRFQTTFDYPGHRLFLKPNEAYKEPRGRP